MSRGTSANGPLETPQRIEPAILEAVPPAEEAAIRGEFDRGDAQRITGLPERTARRVLNDAIAAGVLASDTPKGPVSLRFPPKEAETMFPRLFQTG